MTDYPRELLAQALRQDLASMIRLAFRTVSQDTPYRHNWHIDAIAYAMRQCIEGKWKRLIITMPPRSLKSICTSVALPAYILGRNPSAQIICVSYAQDLAVRLSRDCRALMLSALYRLAFPGTIIDPRKNTESLFETKARGVRRATSVGGTLTGHGGDWIIIDDPLKADDATSESARAALTQWYSNTLVSRLNDKENGVIILVQQRLHQDDLVGHLLEQDANGWHMLNLPAIAETEETIQIGEHRYHCRKVGDLLHAERESRETLEALRAQMGSQSFAAQYQQAPLPAEGVIIRTAWLRFYGPEELPPKFDRIIQSWDTANKAEEHNDFSVGTTWGQKGNKLYLLDVWRQRAEFPGLLRAVQAQKLRWKPSVIVIEDCASGQQLLQTLNTMQISGVKPQKPAGDKAQRLHTASVHFENGTVHLPKSASWLEEYIREITGFPNTKHADQVDSTTQALAWFLEKGQEPGMIAYYRMMYEAKMARERGEL